ncbi:MAG: DUF2029 domain-containing protein [Clostridia bacterium]|nr:DUF2029 domain-containing protein [Clostridia bacterium]
MPLTQKSVPWHLALPCAGAGAVLLAFAVLKTSGLSLGSGPFVGLCVAALAALSIALLSTGAAENSVLCMCLLPIGLAFFLRVLCLDHVTYDYQDFLSGWAAFFRENGGWAAIALPKGNYNVPYLYFLAAISYLAVPDLYLIKLFSLLFDVLLAWGGLRLVRIFTRPESRKSAAAFCLLLLLPTVILNGAYWGQCDAIYGALVLHALASVFEKRPAASVVLLALAFSFKLQTVFIIPLWCAFWFLKKVRFRDLLLFPAVSVLTALPAVVLGKPIPDILSIYFGQMEDYSAYLTLNAPSLYALIPYGKEVDVALFSSLGILAAFLLVALLLLVLYLNRERVTDRSLLTAAVILTVGVPLLLPHMHDRYFFLADVLALCWAVLSPRQSPLAAGVQIASLGGYHAYLVLRYAFPMAWGALLLLLVLAVSWHRLYVQMKGGAHHGALRNRGEAGPA